MFWRKVLKYSERLGEQESHLSAKNIFPMLDEIFLCIRHAIRNLKNREVDDIIQQSMKNEVRTVFFNFCLKAYAFFSSCIFIEINFSQ